MSGVGGRSNFFLYFFAFRCLLYTSRVKFRNEMVSNGVGGRTTFFFFFLDFVTYMSRVDFQNEMASSGVDGWSRFFFVFVYFIPCTHRIALVLTNTIVFFRITLFNA